MEMRHVTSKSAQINFQQVTRRFEQVCYLWVFQLFEVELESLAAIPQVFFLGKTHCHRVRRPASSLSSSSLSLLFVQGEAVVYL